MGVDFSHGVGSRSYSGFQLFREEIAAEIGINLDEMEGFGGDWLWDGVEDSVRPLLDHSDCDGHLTPDECRLVAPRLRELAADAAFSRFNEQFATQLADGMDCAAEAGENLEFF